MPSNRWRSRVPNLQGAPGGQNRDIHLTFSRPRLQRSIRYVTIAKPRSASLRSAIMLSGLLWTHPLSPLFLTSSLPFLPPPFNPSWASRLIHVFSVFYLCYKDVVWQLLSCFHYSHDCSLNSGNKSRVFAQTVHDIYQVSYNGTALCKYISCHKETHSVHLEVNQLSLGHQRVQSTRRWMLLVSLWQPTCKTQ